MTDRERLIELLKNDNCPSPYLCDENCKYAKLKRCYEARTADYLLEHGVIVPPCKVKDLIDTIIGHNEVVGIWERRKGEEGRYHVLLWRGMAWDIPEEYLNRTFLKIFGIVPESMSTADTVNIAITPILKPREEAEQALKERK